MINGARGIRTLDRQRPGLIPKIGWYPAKLDDSPLFIKNKLLIFKPKYKANSREILKIHFNN